MVHPAFEKAARKLRDLGPNPRYANRHSRFTKEDREAYDKASKQWDRDNK